MLSIFSEKPAGKVKEFDPSTVPEAGSQLGILIQVIDLGVQPAREFRDPRTGVVDQKRPSRTIRLTFELPSDTLETEEGVKPKIIGIDVPLSSNDKSRCFNWYRVFDAAMADQGDWFRQLGKGCTITIVHDKAKAGSKYEGWIFAKIGAVTPPMRGIAVPPPFNPLVQYNSQAHDQDVFDSLPPFIQTKINGRIGGTPYPMAERQERPAPQKQAQPARGAALDQDW